MKKLFFLIPLLIVFLMTSCSIQKRHYMNGYSIQWNKNKNANKNTAPEKETTDIEKIISNDISASAGNDITPIIIEKPTALLSIEKPIAASDSCDIIRLKDKSVIHGKVTEINASSVKYKDCDDVRGVIRTISKDVIAGITYGNGREENPEVLKPYKEAEPNDYRLKNTEKSESNPETEKLATSSRKLGWTAVGLYFGATLLSAAVLLFIIASILGGSVSGLFVLALIFGLFALVMYIASFVLSISAIAKAAEVLNAIKKNPKDVIYKNKAITGLVLGIIVIVLFILLILLAFGGL